MKIGGLLENSGLVLYKITALKDMPGTAGDALKIFAKNSINLEYITESSTTDGQAVMAICVAEEDEEKVDKIFNENEDLANSLHIQKTSDVSVFGIYGPHFREKPAIAAQLCVLIGKAGVNILGMSSSISSICCIIKTDKMQDARQSVLEVFRLP